MHVRELRIRHLRRISNLTLRFQTPWTVIVGGSGTCKTSILQAVAMTAAGSLHVNGLVGGDVHHLVDRRGDDLSMEIETLFDVPVLGKMERLRSAVTLRGSSSTLFGSSEFDSPGLRNGQDPLNTARSNLTSDSWLVAGYGAGGRTLPDTAVRPAAPRPAYLTQSLFGSGHSVTSTGFANYFDGDPRRTKNFMKALRVALEAVPGIMDFNLSSRGGVRNTRDLQDRHQFLTPTGRTSADWTWVPAAALSRGQQSTLSWVADLVGQAAASSKSYVAPGNMTGVVLLDDLFLHVDEASRLELLSGIHRIFPRLQFIMTTQSDHQALHQLAHARVIRLDVDPETGDVVVKE